ncbi:MAG: hypothetical protein IPK63_15935 [Candidatus Competibacteraceae bacterium]|nr:hypothetical protein [Candidatus Competibacteraceae bacterium]
MSKEFVNERPRYLLFSGQDYGNQGGWSDFLQAYDDLDKAKQQAVSEVNKMYDSGLGIYWAHVVDLEKLEIIYWYVKE